MKVRDDLSRDYGFAPSCSSSPAPVGSFSPHCFGRTLPPPLSHSSAGSSLPSSPCTGIFAYTRAPSPSASFPRLALTDRTNAATSALAPYASGRVSSSSRAPDPAASLADIRKAAALSLPYKAARQARAANALEPSEFRPHVPADRRLLLWTSPHSMLAHDAMRKAGLPLELQVRIFEGLLRAHEPETRETYGAGLLRYSQFCDRKLIGESARMPADRFLLAAFVADAIGTCSGKCIRNWLCGLRLWHVYNDAPWHGDDGWLPALKKSADKAGVSFKRPPRGPITREHMRAYRATLDLSTPYGAARWSTATSCFWGCRRLGELVIRSRSKFSRLRDTCRSTRIARSVVNGRAVRAVHLVWTKTTTTEGGELILTAMYGPDADLCPVWAFDNHERVNHSPPPDTPLFAYRTASGWRSLTKDTFLADSSAVFRAACLDLVFGHSYRIGGSLALLEAGVAPEVIMKLGGWTSLCFLIYWRRLAQILPLAITRAWDTRIAEFARAHGHSADIDALSFDD
ncbi:putative tyrosine recombinase [Mycena polygramma]|nr:putative tyrosine recombinase [Mycena polygramma]